VITAKRDGVTLMKQGLWLNCHFIKHIRLADWVIACPVGCVYGVR